MFGESFEDFLDVDLFFGTGFEKRYAQTVCEFLSFLFADFPLFFQIAFVAHYKLDHLVTCVFLDLAEPRVDVVEGVPVSDVVHQDDSVGPFVVGGCYGFEPFLPSGVPDVQLDSVVLDSQVFDFEIDSDGREEGVMEYVVREPQQNVTLPHRRVPYD